MNNPKTVLRKFIRQQKTLLTPAAKAAAELAVAEVLAAYRPLAEASTVLLYASLPDEVPTLRLLSELSDKRIVLPRVVGEDLELRLYTGPDDLLVSEQYGIPEPVGPLLADYGTIDVAIIPGMAFDGEGHRLGRGKGFYDRLFANACMQRVRKAGLCYDFQFLSQVPHEAHDIVMDDVIVVPTKNSAVVPTKNIAVVPAKNNTVVSPKPAGNH